MVLALNLPMQQNSSSSPPNRATSRAPHNTFMDSDKAWKDYVSYLQKSNRVMLQKNINDVREVTWAVKPTKDALSKDAQLLEDLRSSCSYGDLNTAQRLLNDIVNAALKIELNHEFLHAAVMNGHYDVMKLLLVSTFAVPSPVPVKQTFSKDAVTGT